MPETETPPDFYYFNTGPFTVRVYDTPARVEATARVYLANNKYFGFEMDYGEDLGEPTVEPLKPEDALRPILRKETELIAINIDRFNPPIPNGEAKTTLAINFLGQLALFNSRKYVEAVPRRQRYLSDIIRSSRKTKPS